MGSPDARDADRILEGRSGPLSYAGITHPGQTRRRNEDTFWVDEDASLFIVADGMGGHRRGAESARSAVVTIAKILAESPGGWRSFLPEGLRQRLAARRAFAAANGAVISAALGGGGTTADALQVRGPRAFVAHVGDSRVYLLRSRKLRQVTRDHTVGESTSRKGASDPEATDDSQALTRVLGSSAALARPDHVALDVIQGDTFLLSSDGLHGLVPERRIEALLSEHWGEPMATCRKLVEAALAAGGTDNVTVLVVKA